MFKSEIFLDKMNFEKSRVYIIRGLRGLLFYMILQMSSHLSMQRHGWMN